MIQIILLISEFVFIYIAGKMKGEKETLERISGYIKLSNNWNEFMEKISVDFIDNNIEE